mmetsp:Transcript_18115/g.28073  ORF Transcript_18115/g.28073 Transcript_18115/m.28073 type:complete len:246 (+) Transcript_18115:44-781(+)
MAWFWLLAPLVLWVQDAAGQIQECCRDVCSLAAEESTCHNVDPVPVCGSSSEGKCYCRWGTVITTEPDSCFADQHPEEANINQTLLIVVVIPVLVVVGCLMCLYKKSGFTKASLGSINMVRSLSKSPARTPDVNSLESGTKSPQTLNSPNPPEFKFFGHEPKRAQTQEPKVGTPALDCQLTYQAETPQVPQDTHIKEQAKGRRSSLVAGINQGVRFALQKVSSFGSNRGGELTAKPEPVVLKIRT